MATVQRSKSLGRDQDRGSKKIYAFGSSTPRELSHLNLPKHLRVASSQLGEALHSSPVKRIQRQYHPQVSPTRRHASPSRRITPDGRKSAPPKKRASRESSADDARRRIPGGPVKSSTHGDSFTLPSAESTPASEDFRKTPTEGDFMLDAIKSQAEAAAALEENAGHGEADSGIQEPPDVGDTERPGQDLLPESMVSHTEQEISASSKEEGGADFEEKESSNIPDHGDLVSPASDEVAHPEVGSPKAGADVTLLDEEPLATEDQDRDVSVDREEKTPSEHSEAEGSVKDEAELARQPSAEDLGKLGAETRDAAEDRQSDKAESEGEEHGLEAETVPEIEQEGSGVTAESPTEEPTKGIGGQQIEETVDMREDDNLGRQAETDHESIAEEEESPLHDTAGEDAEADAVEEDEIRGSDKAEEDDSGSARPSAVGLVHETSTHGVSIPKEVEEEEEMDTRSEINDENSQEGLTAEPKMAEVEYEETEDQANADDFQKDEVHEKGIWDEQSKSDIEAEEHSVTSEHEGEDRNGSQADEGAERQLEGEVKEEDEEEEAEDAQGGRDQSPSDTAPSVELEEQQLGRSDYAAKEFPASREESTAGVIENGVPESTSEQNGNGVMDSLQDMGETAEKAIHGAVTDLGETLSGATDAGSRAMDSIGSMFGGIGKTISEKTSSVIDTIKGDTEDTQESTNGVAYEEAERVVAGSAETYDDDAGDASRGVEHSLPGAPLHAKSPSDATTPDQIAGAHAGAIGAPPDDASSISAPMRPGIVDLSDEEDGHG